MGAADLKVFAGRGAFTLAVLAVPAFWPGYLSTLPGGSDVYVHAHALAGASWLALLVAQPLLLRSGHARWHRRLGRLSWGLAPCFVLSAVLLAHARFSRMDATRFAAEAYTLYLPLSAALLFACAYALAMRRKHDAPLHGRLMACTGVILVDPVVGRVLGLYVIDLPQFWHYQLLTFGLEIALLAVLLRTLSASHAGRRLFAGFCVFYSIVLGLWFLLPHTAAWTAFATWFRTLPLT